MIQQLVDIHVIHELVDIDLIDHGVHVYPQQQRIDIQRLNHEIDNTLGDTLGSQFHLVGHTFRCRPQRVDRGHATSMTAREVAGTIRRG